MLRTVDAIRIHVRCQWLKGIALHRYESIVHVTHVQYIYLYLHIDIGDNCYVSSYSEKMNDEQICYTLIK